jgi:hypothetical protein|tara:strand:- start:413 stop:664 length:252 start_codon:yes stop_codon:yes gene_type:complete
MIKKLKVKSVSYNGHQTGSLEMGLDFTCDYVEIGKVQHLTKRMVVYIKEHTPSNGLEKHFVDIIFEDGGMTRIFNLTEIEYSY